MTNTNNDFESDIKFKGDETAREILKLAIDAADWEIVHSEVGFSFTQSFNLFGDLVKSEVTFAEHEITLHVVSPIEVTLNKYFPQPYSFVGTLKWHHEKFTDKTGVATSKCLSVAKDFLTQIYSDYTLLKMNVDFLREKSRRYPAFRDEFLVKSEVEISALKVRIKEESRKSAQLRRDFKEGKYNMEEYREKWRPHRELISKLLNQKAEEMRQRPFEEFYGEELKMLKSLVKEEILRAVLS